MTADAAPVKADRFFEGINVSLQLIEKIGRHFMRDELCLQRLRVSFESTRCIQQFFIIVVTGRRNLCSSPGTSLPRTRTVRLIASRFSRTAARAWERLFVP